MKNFILLIVFLVSLLFTACGNNEGNNDNTTPKDCNPKCADYQICNFQGKCVTDIGKCETSSDCSPATPICNTETHLCEKENNNFECYDLDGDGFGAFCDKGEDCDDSNPLVNPDAKELCGDKIDNNCNRVVDEFCSCINGEIKTCHTSSDDKRNVGVCKDGYKVCENGSFSSCQYEILPSDEVFDGLDNDCDGNTDEGFEVNACGEIGVVPDEICGNGLDDNCNGIIDENCGSCTEGDVRNCYSGIPKNLGVGECKAGTQTCTDGVWGVCENEIKPTSEICDNKDNNCDGKIDEGVLNACGTCGDVAEETCDGIDNNCNGEIDEGLVNACGVCGVDTPVPDEVCGNGIDDNCDGIIDEGCTCSLQQECYLGPDGTRGKGVCKAGVQQCIAGEYYDANCVGQVIPSIELCDGLDNDCNEKTDEGFNVGESCFVGLGACKTEGIMVCDSDKRGSHCEPNSEIPEPTEEICDGIDNNCNGSVDENFALVNQECFKGIGACQGAGTYICNDAKNGVICTAEEDLSKASEEICDQMDNNCNGFIDEGFEFVGTTCQGGKGVCATTGIYQCSDDGLEIVCDATGDTSLQVDEICGDNLDNDCDGFIDEGFEQLNESCSSGRGVCATIGNYQCSDDGLSLICDAEEDLSLARTELCGDNEDNDCDGLVDEGFNLVGFECEAGLGVCKESGHYVCSDDKLSVVCDAVENGNANQELCGNNTDDNCNGLVNEGFEDEGKPCTVGSGPCQMTGVWVCDADNDSKSLKCSVEPDMTKASIELCGDNEDNDCDGLIDEGFDLIGAICKVGKGVCKKEGVYQCSLNKLELECSETEDLSLKTTELCGDNLDNDCDGLIDEGFNVGESCSAGYGPCKVEGGVYICDVNDLTKTVCNVSPDMSKASQNELCGDNIDNNCNGYVDEGFEMLTVSCSNGVGACKRNGEYQCSEDKLSLECSATPGTPSANELCGNNIDDNCNGLVDEGFELEGETCYAGKGVCQGSGTYSCNSSLLSLDCSATEDLSQQTTELCGDNKDNDCDGFVDEGFTIGATCSNNELGLCLRTGVTECVNGAEVCSAGHVDGTPEVCDGKDNDCDGETDEDFTELYDVCYSSGLGVCKTQGVKICDPNDNTLLICSAEDIAGTTEVCNDGLDNDCDGDTDYDDDDCELPTYSCGTVPTNPVILETVNLSNTVTGVPDSMFWEVVSQPVGSNIILTTPTSASTSFVPLIAGDYHIKFTITIDGTEHVCDYDNIFIQPSDTLNVSILWQTPADFDLHLLKPGATVNDWQTENDCYYDNCKVCAQDVQIPNQTCSPNNQIEWFTSNSSDDAQLDVDNRIGCADTDDNGSFETCYPENTSIEKPHNGSSAEHYTVGLYYYSGKPNGREGEGSSNVQDVTVTIYCRDDIHGSIQEHKYLCSDMNVGEWCFVRDILWENSTCTIGSATRVISGNKSATDL